MTYDEAKKLKPEDKLICVEADTFSLINGKIYTFWRLKEDVFLGSLIYIKEKEHGFFLRRFELHEEKPEFNDPEYESLLI